MQLTLWGYRIVRELPKEEDMLRQDIYHTLIDLPATISESFAKSLPPDIIRKLHQARHDLFRLHSLFELAYQLGYTQEHTLGSFHEKAQHIFTLINQRTSRYKRKM